jgi:hypothetical protein
MKFRNAPKAKGLPAERVIPGGSHNGAGVVRENVVVGICQRGTYIAQTNAGLVQHWSVKLREGIWPEGVKP